MKSEVINEVIKCMKNICYYYKKDYELINSYIKQYMSK